MSWIGWLILGGLALFFGGTALTGAPYVPSRRQDLRRAFDELCELDDDDVVVDFGCGDGVVLRQVAGRGARAIGYELNPVLVLIARWLSRNQPLVQVKLANMWRVELPHETTLVYLFGDGRDIGRMERWLGAQVQKRGCSLSVMSYGFELPSHKPIRTVGAHHLYRLEPNTLQPDGAHV